MVIDFDSSTVLLAVIIFLPVFMYLSRVKRVGLPRLFFISIFYAYLVGVASKTIFPIFFDDIMRHELGQNVWNHMNFIPLVRLTPDELKTSILNVILFLPFGYILPLSKRCNFREVFSSGLFFSISIEILQFILAFIVGFTFRYIDVNDVIFNTIGIILGYMIYLLFARFFQWLIQTRKLENNLILDYLDLRTRGKG